MQGHISVIPMSSITWSTDSRRLMKFDRLEPAWRHWPIHSQRYRRSGPLESSLLYATPVRSLPPTSYLTPLSESNMKTAGKVKCNCDDKSKAVYTIKWVLLTTAVLAPAVCRLDEWKLEVGRRPWTDRGLFAQPQPSTPQRISFV